MSDSELINRTAASLWFNTAPLNLTGHPALSIPSGYDTDGLPTAVQLIAAHFDEYAAFRAAFALERALAEAGVLEDGSWTQQEEGTPQGGSASPLLANLYLHYAFDQWIQQWRRKKARGEVIVVLWRDPAVGGAGGGLRSPVARTCRIAAPALHRRRAGVDDR